MRLNDEQISIVETDLEKNVKKLMVNKIELTEYIGDDEISRPRVLFDGNKYKEIYGKEISNTMCGVFVKKLRTYLKENGVVKYVVYDKDNKVYCRYNYSNLTKGEKHVNPMEQYFNVLQEYKKGIEK